MKHWKCNVVLSGTMLCAASMAVDAAEPMLTFDFESEPEPGHYTRYYGALGNGRSGVPVAGGFDCDGDGFMDAAFSNPEARPFNRLRAGMVTLVFGNGEIGGEVDTSVLNETVLAIAGAQLIEDAGVEIWMDDVDGDGTGDLLVGRQNFSPPFRHAAGGLTVIYGGPELRGQAAKGEILDLGNVPESIAVTHFYGANVYDRFGIWMRTGDVTGDGIADMAVGADEFNRDGEVNRGAVYVIRGGRHLREQTSVDLAALGGTSMAVNVASIHPPAGSANHHFGATLHLADLDGNGRSEIMIAAALDRGSAGLRAPGAPAEAGNSQGGAPHGRCYIVWDSHFPASQQWQAGLAINLDAGADTTTIDGADFNVRFGEELLGGGDFDGDGKADLFAGDLRSNTSGESAGMGFLFFDIGQWKGQHFSLASPPESLRLTAIFGGEPGALGCDAAAHGDFDGDGLSDLVVTSPHDNPSQRISAGSLHVLYGKRGTWPASISLQSEALPDPSELRIAQLIGAHGSIDDDAGDTLGYSLTAFDVNGDGFTDIITNEMQGNGIPVMGLDRVDVGNLVILSGRTLLAAPPSSPVITAWKIVNDGINQYAELKILTAVRQHYQVEKSSNLQLWEAVGDVIQGNGRELSFSDPFGAPEAYYRVQFASDGVK